MIGTVVVMAKACVPGRVKTRLTPPLSPGDAARVAAASLDDTLRVVRTLEADRRVLCFDGTPTPTQLDGFELRPQSGGGLDARIAEALDACDGPTLLLGMDTPQLTDVDLAPALGPWPTGVDAWMGPATDGGYWALALRRPRGDLVRGVPMSRADTGAIQLRRLHDAGLRVALLAELTDIDTIDDLRVVGRSPHPVAVHAALDEIAMLGAGR